MWEQLDSKTTKTNIKKEKKFFGGMAHSVVMEFINAQVYGDPWL